MSAIVKRSKIGSRSYERTFSGVDGAGVGHRIERAAGAHERERGPPQELRLHARQLRRPPGGARPGDGRLARSQVRSRWLQLRLLAEVSERAFHFQRNGVHACAARTVFLFELASDVSDRGLLAEWARC